MSRKTGPAGRRSARFGRLAVIFGVPAALLLWGGSGFAAGLTYNGSYQTAENDGGEFIDHRTQSAGLSLSHELTNVISLREYVRYTDRWKEEGDERTEQVTQGISLFADHKLSRTNLSATSTLAVGGNHKQLDTEYYEARWGSKWQTDVMPGLAVRLSNRKETRERGDSEDREMSTALDWRRDGLSLAHDYRWRQNNPNLLDTTNSHDFKAGYARSFWQDRLSLGLRHNYRTSSLEREARQTGSVSLVVGLSAVRTGTDNTPADAFEDPAVVLNNQMHDSVLNVPAYGVTSNSSGNNILIALNGDNVDQIYLYTETDHGSAALSGLTWSVYANDLLGAPWDVVPLTGIGYDSTLQRYELNIGGLAVDYLKIVLDVSLLGPDINFTEIEARDHVYLTSNSVLLSENNSSLTDFSFSARLTENLLFSYRAGVEMRETISPHRKTERNELSHSAGAKYSSPDQTFVSSLNFGNRSRETEEDGGVTENETRSYAIDLDKRFLPTLSAAAGISRSETYQGSTQLVESQAYRLDGFAKLYPDLDLAMHLNYAETTNIQTSTKSENNSAAVSLTSRLSPAITMGLRENYTESGASRSYKTNLSLNWQISSMLVIRGWAGHIKSKTATADSAEALDFNSSLNLALTRAFLLEVDYNSTRAGGQVTETGEASLNWYPRGWLRLEVGCSYRHAPALPADDYRGFGRVDINFRAP